MNLVLHLIRRTLFISSLGIASCACFAADIKQVEDRILFSGEIQSGDLQKLEALKFDGGSPPERWMRRGTIFLGSPGGDLEEALRIGRWIRENRLGVIVSGPCFSSCVFLIAAGLTRTLINAEVGIHRPFFTEDINDDYDVEMKILLEQSRSFFEHMNIPSSLADHIFSIPPEQMLILDQEALSRYRLNQDDMGYKERNDFALAEYYGVSRQEYMRRSTAAGQDIEKYCRDMPTLDMIECANKMYRANGLVPSPN